MEAVLRTKNKVRKCDDTMCVVTFRGLVFSGLKAASKSCSPPQKTRTDILKPTQPLKLWNESYMTSKDTRSVHKARKQASKLAGRQATRHASKQAAGRQA